MSEHTIIIESDGSIKFLWADELSCLGGCGTMQVNRQSIVDYDGAAGGWTADMSPSGNDAVLGPFPLRQQALEAEVAFLEERMAQ